MTDKEKLKEIKKLADAMYYAAFNLTTDTSLLRKAMKEYHQFIIHEYCKEEPVAPKVLEDMLNAKTAAESLGISQEEHDRIVDELIYGKEPEYLDDFLALEEIPPKFPLISQKKCMFTKDSYTNEDRKVLCEDCKEKCEYNKKEEPVSEDFEEALAREWKGYNDRGAATVDALEDNTQELAFAKWFYRGAKWQKEKDFQYIKKECERVGSCCDEDIAIEAQRRHPYYYTSDIEAYANIGFKEGAMWQKQQDQSTIELAEDHAMLAGMEKMKQQMMAKAKSGTVQKYNQVILDDGTYIDLDPSMQLKPSLVGLKEGDRIKVIMIKVY